MSFIETPRFPDDISYGSSGGPCFSTTVVEVASGREKRNINWSQARAKYNVSMGVRSQAQLDDLVTLYRAVYGRAYAFRYKDWADYKATQAQGVLVSLGGGVYQMYKRYTFGSVSYDRIIQKPVSGSITLHGGTGTIDYTTGKISGSTATAWSGEFDVPVRFDTDEFNASIDDFETYNSQVNLIEVRV